MLEIAHARVLVPSDPFIAHRYPPGRAGKLHTSHNVPLRPFGINQVTQVRSKRHGMPEVVIPPHPVREIADAPHRFAPVPTSTAPHRAPSLESQRQHCRPRLRALPSVFPSDAPL